MFINLAGDNIFIQHRAWQPETPAVFNILSKLGLRRCSPSNEWL
jgi:hypothetical protein